MAIIPQTLNVDNLRTTNAKSINLHVIKKFIKYSFKNVPVKAIFTLTIFEMLLFEDRLVLLPTQRGTGSERVNINIKHKHNLLRGQDL